MHENEVNLVYEKIKTLLQSKGISYKEIFHSPEGKTANVSKLRGNRLSQAAKAMVVQIKLTNSNRFYVLAVIPGDRKLDFDKIKRLFNAKSVHLASADKAQQLTNCQMGSVPPFSFHEALHVIVDSHLKENTEIFFNAGRLDRSIMLNGEEYFELLHPRIEEITAAGQSQNQKEEK